MQTFSPEYPKILLTQVAQPASVPRWMERFSPRLASSRQLRALAKLPRLTVVQAKAPQTILGERGFLRQLALRLHRTSDPAKILFFFDVASPKAHARQLLELLTFFDRTADVDFACGRQQAVFALNAAFAKIWAHAEPASAHPPSPDPLAPNVLAKVKSVLAATADLRGESGRLSASRVAEAFGMAVAELAALLGRNRQTVSKTPEAASLLPLLAPFERVARLRAVLPSPDFLRWLHMPNPQLAGQSPRAVIAQGRVEVVADLAEDMLTGSPV